MTRSALLFGAGVTLVASCVAALVGALAASRQRDHIMAHSLTLLDDRNQPIASLSSNQGSPELALFDRQHKKRAALFLEPNGTPDLYLYDAAGTARAALDLYDSGAPNLAFSGAAGGREPVMILEYSNDHSVRFASHDFQGSGTRVQGTLQFTVVDNQPRMELLDAKGNRLWVAP